MKYVNTYDDMNESWFSNLFKKEENDYDEIVEGLFDNIKKSFNIENLNLSEQYYEAKFSYLYKGMKVSVIYDKIISNNYTLNMDDEKVECSKKIIKEIYKYFENAYFDDDKIKVLFKDIKFSFYIGRLSFKKYKTYNEFTYHHMGKEISVRVYHKYSYNNFDLLVNDIIVNCKSNRLIEKMFNYFSRQYFSI